MKKVFLTGVSVCLFFAMKSNAQLTAFPGGVQTNINSIVVHGDNTALSTAQGVYIGHGPLITGSGNIHLNTAVGFHTLYAPYTSTGGQQGSYNSAFGSNALENNTSGTSNSAFGAQALNKQISGGSNSAFGVNALSTDKLGVNNCAFGTNSLLSLNATAGNGVNNAGFGTSTMQALITGSNNTAVGHNALSTNNIPPVISFTSGSWNVALGAFSLYKQTSGNGNIAIGFQAEVPVKNSDYQLSIGNCIFGTGLTSINGTALGNGNIGIGVQAPGAKLHIGGNLKINSVTLVANTPTPQRYLYVDPSTKEVFETTLPAAGITNSCAVTNTFSITNGTTGNLKCSNMFQDATTGGIGIGNPTNINFNYVVGGTPYDNGFSVPAPTTFALAVEGWVSATGFYALSDKRYKNNIEAIESPLAKILKVNGYTYNWNKDFDKSKKLDDSRQIGFLAQDLEKIIPEAVIKSGDGVYGVNYNAVTPVIVEALKEQQIQIETLKQTVAALQAKLGGDNKTISVTLTENKLFQNSPNPFSSITKIEYVVTSGDNSYISIANLEGKTIKTIKLSNAGKGIVELNAGSLRSGTYTYSLYANAILVDTKLMVINK